MATRVTVVLLLKEGDSVYKDDAGAPRLKAENGADFPLGLALSLGRGKIESVKEEDADQEPEPVGLFG